MINPFSSLGLPDKNNPRGELVEGQFSCQERECFNIVKEARYLEEARMLTWICAEGHVSKIEGFII